MNFYQSCRRNFPLSPSISNCLGIFSVGGQKALTDPTRFSGLDIQLDKPARLENRKQINKQTKFYLTVCVF